MVHRECLMACYKDFIGTREGWSEQLALCLIPPCVMHLLKPMPKITSHHFVFHACMCVHTITEWQWIILKENLVKLHFALVNLNIQLTLCFPALCWLLLIGCFDLLQVQVQRWGSVVVVLWGLVLAVLPISQGLFRLKLWDWWALGWAAKLGTETLAGARAQGLPGPSTSTQSFFPSTRIIKAPYNKIASSNDYWSTHISSKFTSLFF